MKEAHINCVSLGIFAWAKLEPREGDYQLDWMAEIIDRLYKNGIYTILARRGAKPMWMSEKYPEIRRVSGATGHRELSGNRHNHCYTSPIYREKVRQINTVLAKRFSHHPGVILWHVSNEYGGECHCELCQQAFRDWLREKYGTIEALNHAWWADFWSHTYSDFSQITSPMVGGEHSIHGLTLDWKRFVTHQTVDFMRAEIAAVHAVNPDLPVTTNMMGWYDGLNYYKFAPYMDIGVVGQLPPLAHRKQRGYCGRRRRGPRHHAVRQACAVAVDGKHPEHDQLAAHLHAQASGYAHDVFFAGRGARFRFRAVFPVAQRPRLV